MHLQCREGQGGPAQSPLYPHAFGLSDKPGLGDLNLTIQAQMLGLWAKCTECEWGPNLAVEGRLAWGCGPGLADLTHRRNCRASWERGTDVKRSSR